MWEVSLTVGALALVGAGLIATVGKQKWPRIAVALTLTGVSGLVNGSFGPTLHNAVTKADHAVGQATNTLLGTAITGVIGIIIVGWWVLWVYNGKLDLGTLALSAAVPLVVNLIPGMLGTAAIYAIGIIPQVTSGLISLLYFGSWGG